MAGRSTKSTKSTTSTKGGNSSGGAPKAALKRAPQQAQQEQNATAGLGALSKREQQNLGRWAGGIAQLLNKAGIEVPMSQPA